MVYLERRENPLFLCSIGGEKMSKRLSTASKKKRHMGEGEGKDYKPYITTSEFNSLGTTSVIVDWKTGRGIHCLSQGEAYWYYILRWDDNNLDIREQFPMEREETIKIADSLGFKHPENDEYIMTIDFLATEADGKLHAYSVKSDKESLTDRMLEILCIEKTYWESKGVLYTLLFKTDADLTLVHNIRDVVRFYNAQNIFDKVSLIKHKIATKEASVDMSNKELTNCMILELMEEEDLNG